MKNVLLDYKYDEIGTDIIDRNGCVDNVIDFLDIEKNPYPERDIITNPPYRHALDFAKKALNILDYGKKCVLFVKIQFLEGKARNVFFKNNPPKYIYIHSSRVNCARLGEFDKYKSRAVCYCWVIFEKGYVGDSIVRWID